MAEHIGAGETGRDQSGSGTLNSGTTASVWTIVVAGGSGTRFGGRKLEVTVRGLAVLDWSVASALASSDGVVVVAHASIDTSTIPDDVLVVAGGETRAASVRAGLAVVPSSAEVIVVHDAARPLATPELFRATVQAIRDGADAAIAAIPVVDTIKRVRDDIALATIDRSDLVAVQTPQAFRASVLRQAHQANGEATDDAGLVELLGGRVVIVMGEESNRKLTTPEDHVVLEALAEAANRRPAVRSNDAR